MKNLLVKNTNYVWNRYPFAESDNNEIDISNASSYLYSDTCTLTKVGNNVVPTLGSTTSVALGQ